MRRSPMHHSLTAHFRSPRRVAVLAVGVATFLAPNHAEGQPPGAAPAAPVTVTKLIERRLELGETFVGTVKPVRRSTVGSPVGGRVEQFMVNEGDRVTIKQPLVQLRTASLELGLDAAKADLAIRTHELAELQASAPKEIVQAKARMESAKAKVAMNQKRLQRFVDLRERNTMSPDDLEEQVYQTEAAKKSYEELAAAYELATSGLWDAKIEQARSRVAVQKAIVDKLDDEIRLHTIVAPFHGFVTKEHTEVGQWLTAGAPVAEIVELDYVDVELPLLERYLPEVRIGSVAKVRIEALPGRVWSGHVASIVPEADSRSRSFPVKVRLKNELKEGGPGESRMVIDPGMFARVTLSVGERASVLLAPKDAVVFSQNKPPVVWVVQPAAGPTGERTALPLPVILGESFGSLIEVRGWLEPGQLVVIEGNERIRPMQPLKLTEVPPPEPPSTNVGKPDTPSEASPIGRPTK